MSNKKEMSEKMIKDYEGMNDKMKENICEECGKELKESEKGLYERRLCKSCFKKLDNILIPILDKNGFTIDVVTLAEPNWYEREENKGKNIYDEDDEDDEDDDEDDEDDVWRPWCVSCDAYMEYVTDGDLFVCPKCKHKVVLK